MLKFWKKDPRPTTKVTTSTPWSNTKLGDPIGLYCPRCDRSYIRKPGETHTELLNRVKNHVTEQHPDHDPGWHDTYPDHED